MNRGILKLLFENKKTVLVPLWDINTVFYRLCVQRVQGN